MILFLLMMIEIEVVDCNRSKLIEFKVDNTGYWLREPNRVWHWDKTGKVDFEAKSEGRPISFVKFRGNFIIGWAARKGKYWIEIFNGSGNLLRKINDFYADYFIIINDELHTSPSVNNPTGSALVPLENWTAKSGYFSRPLPDQNFREVWAIQIENLTYAVTQLEPYIHVFQDKQPKMIHNLAIPSFKYWEKEIDINKDDIQGSARRWFLSFSRVVGFGNIGDNLVFAFEPVGQVYTEAYLISQKMEILRRTRFEGWAREGLWWAGTNGQAAYLFNRDSFRLLELPWPD